MFGTPFEAIGQDVLPEGLNITLLPMIRLTQKPNAKTCPRWYSSHTFLSNKTLEAKRQQARLRSQRIQIPRITTRECKANEVLSITAAFQLGCAKESFSSLSAAGFVNGFFGMNTFPDALEPGTGPREGRWCPPPFSSLLPPRPRPRRPRPHVRHDFDHRHCLHSYHSHCHCRHRHCHHRAIERKE